jgi:putative multiple sugar transport system permease protein
MAVAMLVNAFLSRGKKQKKGYSVPAAAGYYAKIIIIDLLIVAYSWKLSSYKGIPVMILWVLAILLIFTFITSKTAFGRYFYAVGGNEKATKLSGIDTRKVYFAAYFLMSLLAGFSGLLVAARIGSVNGDTGMSYEMDAIGACFIGGASAYGGSGTVPGIVVGAILLGVINQGMSIYGLDNNWQYVVKGTVLLIAVIFDVVSNHKTGKAG